MYVVSMMSSFTTKELNNFILQAPPSLLIDIQTCKMDTQLYRNILLWSYSEHTFL